MSPGRPLRVKTGTLWARKNDPYAQAKQALGNLEAALRGARARLSDEDLRDECRSLGGGRAHGEMFGEIRSTTSMIEVSWLISPEMLVKIKADAGSRGVYAWLLTPLSVAAV